MARTGQEHETNQAERPPAAVYTRRVRANAERVWENVLDWEHLPALHGASFGSIRCDAAGRWGWRAHVTATGQTAELTIELTIDRDDSSYHSRTVAGPGTGSDIFTRVQPVDDENTDIRVEFFLPGSSERQGAAMVALYERLWDEDEAMMRHRQAFLDGRAPRIARTRRPSRLPLGAFGSLESGRIVEADGDPFRLVQDAATGMWLAHTTACPHRGGPLDNAAIESGQIVCPWHGYRFDPATGRGPEGQPCRLLSVATIERQGDDAFLIVRSGSET